MASIITNEGKYVLCAGATAAITWSSGNIGVGLSTTTYAPTLDHEHVDDITNELTGGNYSRASGTTGNVKLGTLTGPTKNLIAGSPASSVSYDAADTIFNSLALAAGQPRWAWTYDASLTLDTTRNLIHVYDLGTGAAAPNGGNYTIQWPAPMFYHS